MLAVNGYRNCNTYNDDTVDGQIVLVRIINYYNIGKINDNTCNNHNNDSSNSNDGNNNITVLILH